MACEKITKDGNHDTEESLMSPGSGHPNRTGINVQEDEQSRLSPRPRRSRRLVGVKNSSAAPSPKAPQAAGKKNVRKAQPVRASSSSDSTLDNIVVAPYQPPSNPKADPEETAAFSSMNDGTSAESTSSSSLSSPPSTPELEKPAEELFRPALGSKSPTSSSPTQSDSDQESSSTTFFSDISSTTPSPGHESTTKNRSHITIRTPHDIQPFFNVYTYNPDLIPTISTLTLHLDPLSSDPFTEDFLAMALSRFHNHHSLIRFTIIVKGSTIFTRNTYTLVSPVNSPDVNTAMQKLLRTNMLPGERHEYPFVVSATEKTVVRALLGFRGIREVEIKGAIEDELAHALKVCMTAASEVPDPEIQWSRLNVVGTHRSPQYHAAEMPYPMRRIQGEGEPVDEPLEKVGNAAMKGKWSSNGYDEVGDMKMEEMVNLSRTRKQRSAQVMKNYTEPTGDENRFVMGWKAAH